MNINLGNKIRSLRKEKNISQEVLATHLGVTFQTISKWENEISMPDITLIPSIASFFGVTTDELFDYNLFKIEQKVSQIVDEYSKYSNQDKLKAEKILRDGLEQYPGNDVLLNCLAEILSLPEKSDEVISICKQLIEKTRYDDVKYDAYRIMAEAYCSTDNYELARATVEKIPEIYFSKLSIEALLLNDNESYEAAQKQKWISFEDMLKMMNKISYHLEKEGNYSKAIAEAEQALKLLNAMKDDPSINCFNEYVTQIKSHISDMSQKA